MLSAFLLGVVLTTFESIFGMPRKELYFLAFWPCVFALYDFICFWRIGKKCGTYLKVIAMANLIYCCMTMALVVHHFQTLTILGLTYFFLELVIVMILVFVELKVAANLT